MISYDIENLTLETLITLHRDRFELRYSTDDDLAGLICIKSDPADGRLVKNSFQDWSFITFEDRHLSDSHVLLTGMRPNGFTCTSAVVNFNPEQGWVITQRGSLYMLHGAPGDKPFGLSKVLFMAGVFNSWGIGETLGMPPVFF